MNGDVGIVPRKLQEIILLKYNNDEKSMEKAKDKVQFIISNKNI